MRKRQRLVQTMYEEKIIVKSKESLYNVKLIIQIKKIMGKKEKITKVQKIFTKGALQIALAYYGYCHRLDLNGELGVKIHLSPCRKALIVNLLACLLVMVLKPFHFTLFFVEAPGPTF